MDDRSSYCKATVEETNIGKGQDLKFVQREIGKCVKVPFISSRGIARPLCPSERLCVASKSQIHDFSTLSGIISARSAVQCRRIDPTLTCRRVSSFHTHHAGSYYQKTIDVGRCLGTCAKTRQKNCKAISSVTVSVNGPNGAQCVKKITKCACSRTCYRVSHKQLFRTKQFDEAAKINRTTAQVDVGRCNGQCYKKTSSSCIYWAIQRTSSGRSRVFCMFKSRKEEYTRCLPRVFKSHQMLDSNGEPRIINIVKRCGCQ